MCVDDTNVHGASPNDEPCLGVHVYAVYPALVRVSAVLAHPPVGQAGNTLTGSSPDFCSRGPAIES